MWQTTIALFQPFIYKPRLPLREPGRQALNLFVMKNLLTVLFITIAAGFTSAHAGENPSAEKEFEKKFTGAENVRWTKLSDGFSKVSFTLNGIRAESYFDQDAELVGTLRNLFYNQLPLPVMQSLSNHFTNAVVIEITEISNADGTSYKVTLENGEKNYILRMDSRGGIIDQQKIRVKK
jgi:hypothetical protein